MPFYIMELTLFAIVFLFGFTQFVIPFWRGTPVLPLLRPESKLEKELEIIRQQQIEDNLKEVITQEKEKIEKKRRAEKNKEQERKDYFKEEEE